MRKGRAEMELIDKLQDMIDRAKLLPLSEQEELAAHIEMLLERLEHQTQRQGTHSLAWQDPAGAWADLPDTVDEMFDALDAIRHLQNHVLPHNALK